MILSLPKARKFWVCSTPTILGSRVWVRRCIYMQYSKIFRLVSESMLVAIGIAKICQFEYFKRIQIFHFIFVVVVIVVRTTCQSLSLIHCQLLSCVQCQSQYGSPSHRQWWAEFERLPNRHAENWQWWANYPTDRECRYYKSWYIAMREMLWAWSLDSIMNSNCLVCQFK